MSRGRYPRRIKIHPGVEALADRYLLYWRSEELYRHPERFPKMTSAELFGNHKPLEMDVGCGTSDFLCEMAFRRPETNFVGVDIARKPLLRAVETAAARALANVRFVRADVKLLYALWEEDALLSIYLHFPAPYRKGKHRKRRIFDTEFLDQVQRTLVPGGRLRVMTDEAAMYAEMRALAAADRRFTCTPEDEMESWMDELMKTHTQRIWEARGRPTLHLELVKR